MARQRKPPSEPVADPKPSEVRHTPWLFAERKIGEYPQHTERGGKWLIFVPFAAIDEVWLRIKQATEHGLLGGLSKVATALDNPHASNVSSKVICVYTYDSDDEADVMLVREQLRELGITTKIPYKSDQATEAGNYRKGKSKRVSKYLA